VRTSESRGRRIAKRGQNWVGENWPCFICQFLFH
jgi:hypothetical protein